MHNTKYMMYADMTKIMLTHVEQQEWRRSWYNKSITVIEIRYLIQYNFLETPLKLLQHMDIYCFQHPPMDHKPYTLQCIFDFLRIKARAKTIKRKYISYLYVNSIVVSFTFVALMATWNWLFPSWMLWSNLNVDKNFEYV